MSCKQGILYSLLNSVAPGNLKLNFWADSLKCTLLAQATVMSWLPHPRIDHSRRKQEKKGQLITKKIKLIKNCWQILEVIFLRLGSAI